MIELQWMSFHLPDLFADIEQLGFVEQWAYIKLLMKIWQRNCEPVADDDFKIARLLNIEVRTWRRLRPAVESFFDISGGFWIHRKLREHFFAVISRRDKYRANGRRNVGKLSNKFNETTQATGYATGHATGGAVDEQRLDINTESLKERSKKVRKKEASYGRVISDASFGLQSESEGGRRGRLNDEPITSTEPSAVVSINTPLKIATAMVDIWRSEACLVGLPAVQKLTDSRVAAAGKRFAEDFDSDLEQWRSYVRLVVDCPFLIGQNDRGWKADFGWVLKPDNMAKILEGKYDWRPEQPRKKSAGETLFEGFMRGADAVAARRRATSFNGEAYSPGGGSPDEPLLDC